MHDLTQAQRLAALRRFAKRRTGMGVIVATLGPLTDVEREKFKAQARFPLPELQLPRHARKVPGVRGVWEPEVPERAGRKRRRPGRVGGSGAVRGTERREVAKWGVGKGRVEVMPRPVTA